jgi:hypothetical protein
VNAAPTVAPGYSFHMMSNVVVHDELTRTKEQLVESVRAEARISSTKFRRDKEARSRLFSMGGLDFDELNVEMQVGDRNTTLSVSADKVVSFVYHLSPRRRWPTDPGAPRVAFALVGM